LPYHVASQLVKVSAKRPPILLGESMVRAGRHVRDTVATMRQAKRRVSEAVAFVPMKDLAGIERIVVESGCDAPTIEGPELVVPPAPAAADLLRLFGVRAYGSLSDAESKQWSELFQRDMNSGKKVVLASAPEDKFAESYAVFHTRPKKLRDESPAAHGFFEKLYGKRMDQLWGV
jgi:hypothetical protein